MKPTYITTSIAYVNADPHICFLFELLAADVLKRYFDHANTEGGAFLVTGTDEHGIKVAEAAKKLGKKPQDFVDEIAGKFEGLGKQFGIEPSYFIRTTNPQHKAFVEEKWKQLHSAGVLKKKSYSGLYCKGCEAFKTASEIENGKCVIHESELEKIEEENWFLVIDAATKEKIKTWITESVYPENRRQEVLNILDSGAYDEVSVSRPRSKNSWGIDVPGDPDQVMYVWVDALFNYISALKISGKDSVWPADLQIIGKDILKFHAIIWPALLLHTGYELPKKLFVHGFITVDGKKLSKSSGHIIYPDELLKRYGPEATRYLLLRQFNFYEDSNFTWEAFDQIYNGELANGLGNLVARTVTLLKKFKGSKKVIEETRDHVSPQLLKDAYENADFQRVIDQINSSRISVADQYITTEKPWLWSEDPGAEKIEELIRKTNLREIADLIEPIMPKTAAEIHRQLTELSPKPLFPRLAK